jgi:hypothetical protein
MCISRVSSCIDTLTVNNKYTLVHGTAGVREADTC